MVNKEVYMKQPIGFQSFEHIDYVYKLENVLYGFMQAPRAWYDRISSFLLEHAYIRRKIDNTLFTNKKESKFLIMQIYMDDIIFGTTNGVL